MEMISVTRNGVKKLVSQLNEMQEGLNATMEIKNGLLILDIAGKLHCSETLLEGIKYIQGVMRGIEIMNQIHKEA